MRYFKGVRRSTDDEALAIVAAYALLGKPMPADAVQVRSPAARLPAAPPPPARAPLPRRGRSSNRLFTPVPPLNPRSMGVRAQRRETKKELAKQSNSGFFREIKDTSEIIF